MKFSLLVVAALAIPYRYEPEYDLAYDVYEPMYDDPTYESYDQDYYDQDYNDQDYNEYYDQEEYRLPRYSASRLSIGRIDPKAYEAVHMAEASGKGFDKANLPAPALMAEGGVAMNRAQMSLNQASEMLVRKARNEARGRADTFDKLANAHMNMASTAMGSAANGLATAPLGMISAPHPIHLPNPVAANAIGRANHLSKVVNDAHNAAKLRDLASNARARANANPNPPASTRPRANAIDKGRRR